jgi:hypothetical protein
MRGERGHVIVSRLGFTHDDILFSLSFLVKLLYMCDMTCRCINT